MGRTPILYYPASFHKLSHFLFQPKPHKKLNKPELNKFISKIQHKLRKHAVKQG